MSWSDRVLTWIKNHSLNEKSVVDKEGGFITPTVAASTPEYIIKVDSIFISNIAGYANYVGCQWFETGITKPNSPDPSTFFNGDRGVVGSNTLVCMEYTRGIVTLQEYLTGGNLINQIIIKRLAQSEMDIYERQALTFGNCHITTYEQKSNLVFFSFSYTERSDEIAVFDNQGKKTGTEAFGFDFNKNQTDSDLGNKSNLPK